MTDVSDVMRGKTVPRRSLQNRAERWEQLCTRGYALQAQLQNWVTQLRVFVPGTPYTDDELISFYRATDREVDVSKYQPEDQQDNLQSHIAWGHLLFDAVKELSQDFERVREEYWFSALGMPPELAASVPGRQLKSLGAVSTNLTLPLADMLQHLHKLGELEHPVPAQVREPQF